MELGELREDRDKANRRCDEIGAVIEVAQKLLDGADTEQVLRDAVVSVGRGIEADSGSLSLLRPNGSMETVVVHNLVVEPLLTTTNENGRELGRLVMEEGKPLVFASDETGPLLEVLDRVGSDCTALVAIPLKTQARTLGLLTSICPPTRLCRVKRPSRICLASDEVCLWRSMSLSGGQTLRSA